MGSNSLTVATCTSPAPPRSAPSPARMAAPLMPREPATMRTRPYVPLWLAGARGAKRGRSVTIVGMDWSRLWLISTRAAGDQGGDVAPFEAAINVDHGHVRGTAV